MDDIDLNDPNRITYLGNIDYRNKMVKFGIKSKDRTRHTYIIGKSGMGKSTLLENMAIQDIQNGEGLAFLDPHGGTAEKLLDFVPEHRIKDVIYFAPFDTEHPLALNVLEKVDINKRHLVANGLMAAFKKVFGEDKFSDRMQYILNNIILTLLENDDETLMGINRMLSDKDYRRKMISNLKDPSVKSFWLEEFAKAGEKYQQEAAPAIQNKIGQYTSNPLIRNIIGQKKTSFDIREIMDNRKILIVNLSKGKVGEGNANLLGSLLITKIYLAAMSRADAGNDNLSTLPPFFFYVDEFQNFANESFADILSEARKYNLALTVAHQYIDQMTEEVKSAVFGNVGTMITFRIGAHDAEVFEKEFAPVFTADDIVNLSAYQIYLRLMIDNVGSKPFSAKALPPIEKGDITYANDIIQYTRDHYSKTKEAVEEEIREWFLPVPKTKHIEEIEELEKQNAPAKINYQFEKNNFNKTNQNYQNNSKTIIQNNNIHNSLNKNYEYSRNENNNQELNESKEVSYNDFRNKRARSKRDYNDKKNDIVEVELSKLRKGVEKQRVESEANHQSLKDALAKAIKIEDGKVKSLKEDNQELEKKIKDNQVEMRQETENIKESVEDIKQDKIKIEEEKRNNLRNKLKEVPEEVLRDLVGEE